MSKLTNQLMRPAFISIALFFSCLVYYGHAALTFPVLFNLDNHANHSATRYIAKHQKLPAVETDTEEISFTSFGTTRLLRPPFTFIVSAVVANAFETMIDDRITRQRLGSPLIAAITVVVVFIGFWIAFQHTGLALLGASIIGLLPKFVFLASCNNDDIGAILSVSVLFSSVLALIRYKHKAWVLCALAIALGLVFQTKYTAWLTLPWFGIFCLIILKPVWRKALKLMPVLLILIVASGGWWIIFNMINYGIDDPSAMRHAAELQRTLVDVEPNRQGYLSEGVGFSSLLGNYDQFLNKSFKSMIGYLEWLDLDIGISAYLFYGALFLIGMVGVGFRSRKSLRQQHYLELLILVLIVSQCAFYLHHNLVRDIQPQARYILPIIVPLVYLFLRLIEQVPTASVTVKLNNLAYGFQTVVATTLIIICSIVHIVTMERYIIPSFNSKPFLTALKKPARYTIEQAFEISSAEHLSYSFTNDELKLQRVGFGLPTLTLRPSFCEKLPLNALITMNVESPSKGGFHLRMDRNKQGSYDSIYWRSFPAGSGTAVFSLNSENCSGAKLTLGKNTYQLSIKNLEISELKIHRYGTPL